MCFGVAGYSAVKPFFPFYENFLELFKVELSLLQLENNKEGVFESKFEVL